MQNLIVLDLPMVEYELEDLTIEPWQSIEFSEDFNPAKLGKEFGVVHFEGDKPSFFRSDQIRVSLNGKKIHPKKVYEDNQDFHEESCNWKYCSDLDEWYLLGENDNL
jgi:hypothetical protein